MLILDELLDGLRGVCLTFPDKRKGAETVYSMVDPGMAGFAPFFMQSESFLAHQRSLQEMRKTSSCQSLFGMHKTPTGKHIRAILDPVAPALLQPVFDQTLETLRARGGLKAFERPGTRTLIALDGTGYFCSQKPGCPNCQTRKRTNGKTDYYHSMLAATIVAPGHDKAFPLMPEFIARQDGAEKQDCERAAAKRWLSLHAERMRKLRPVYPGDDLFACQPVCEALLAHGGDFLFTAKPQSHKALYDFMQGAASEELSQTRKEGAKKLTCRYRWFCGAPLREEKPARDVNWLGVTICDARGKTVYDGAFITSLAVTRGNVAEIAACARARWKIENEGFSVLKNNGYHPEHNFGHGKDNLAMLFAAMNLLAFAMHTACDLIEELWIKARHAKRARKRFFEHIRTITEYLVFPDWKTLMTTLITSPPPPEAEKQICACFCKQREI